MANNHVQEAYLADLQTAHRSLCRQQRQIENLLSDGLQHGWTPATIKTVNNCLADLCQEVERHFRQEEAGGCLEEAVTRLPRLHGDMRRVLDEHRGLLEQLRQTAQVAQALAQSRSAWPRLAERIAKVLGQLKTHEETENRLVEQGFNVSLEDCR